MQREKGFTLVELLVVIAIIALLLSVLLPALNLAREQARAVICGNNARQLGIGMGMYVDIYDGKVPYVYDKNLLGVSGYRRYVPTWYGGIAKVLGWETETDDNGWVAIKLKRRGIMTCRSAVKRFRDIQGDFQKLTFSTPTYMSSLHNYNIKLTQVKRPNEYIFLSDGCPGRSRLNPYFMFSYIDEEPFGATEATYPHIRFRHRGKATHLYFDQHSERFSRAEVKKRGLKPFQAVKNNPQIPLP